MKLNRFKLCNDKRKSWFLNTWLFSVFSVKIFIEQEHKALKLCIFFPYQKKISLYLSHFLHYKEIGGLSIPTTLLKPFQTCLLHTKSIFSPHATKHYQHILLS